MFLLRSNLAINLQKDTESLIVIYDGLLLMLHNCPLFTCLYIISDVSYDSYDASYYFHVSSLLSLAVTGRRTSCVGKFVTI